MIMKDGVLSFMENEKRPIRAVVLGADTRDICVKKKLSFEQAEILIIKRWVNPQKGKNEKNIYYCKDCDAFHTTSL